MARETTSIQYNDLYFRIIISFLAAHIIVTFGAKQSTFELLIMFKYYRSVLASFVIAFLLVSEVYLFTKRLDKSFDWQQETVARIGLQTLLGLIIPCISAFLLATLYFGLYGYKILETRYLTFDFPVIVIMILTVNLYYLAFYFFRRWQLSESRLAGTHMPVKDETQKSREIYVVQKGAKNIPLPVDAICYFYHEGDYNFARTFEKEDFLISQSLDEVQQLLSEKQFFRVNRQMLVNFTACQHFEPLEFGKLHLIVKPESKGQIVVSQKRSKLFKEWVGR